MVNFNAKAKEVQFSWVSICVDKLVYLTSIYFINIFRKYTVVNLIPSDLTNKMFQIFERFMRTRIIESRYFKFVKYPIIIDCFMVSKMS